MSVKSHPKEITPDYLRQIFDYNQETGVLSWRKPLHKKLVGVEAGHLRPDKYRTVNVGGRFKYSHRIIWALVNGSWPIDTVDHIDGDPRNNRISNLRLATHTEQNRNKISHSKRGMPKGVWPNGKASFCAFIRVNGDRIYLGTHKSVDLAHQAYCRAAEKYHGEFFCDGNRK